MVYDFGLMKGNVNSFLDKFDHSIHFWNKDKDSVRKFMKEENERWIELPFSPSAEAYSIFFLKNIRDIIENTKFENGEDETLQCVCVRVHETATGYAEATVEDLELLKWDDEDVIYSSALQE
jgi:6-pyruvoyltetrahydropterin/6-carboxytetrahydropterin synthase